MTVSTVPYVLRGATDLDWDQGVDLADERLHTCSEGC